MSNGRSPAFQFYPGDFMHDQNVVAMTTTERGAYIALLCTAWTDGSIPADIERIARILKEPAKLVRKWWPAIAPCFTEMNGDPSRLVQPRLERERAKQAENRDRRSAAGKVGAKASWQSHSNRKAMPSAQCGNAIEVPMANDGSSSSTSSSKSNNSKARDARTSPDEDAPVDLSGLDDDEPDQRHLRAVPSPGMEFCRWFVAEGVIAGAIDAHFAPPGDARTPIDFAAKDDGLRAAAQLVATYGEDECRARSRRLFAAVVSGEISHRNPRISWLRDRWSTPALASPPPASSPGVPRVTGVAATDNMLARIALAKARLEQTA